MLPSCQQIHGLYKKGYIMDFKSSKGGFIKPVGIAIAALLATASNHASATPALQEAIQKASENMLKEGAEQQQIILSLPTDREINSMAYHTSHASHRSHSSHYSSRF